MQSRIDVGLDVFSGMPNPSWILTASESERFLKQVATLPLASVGELSGRLGYRGFVVRRTQGGDVQLMRVHSGKLRISRTAQTAHAIDQGRGLERWLLVTGKPHLKGELFRLAESDLR